MTLGSHRNSSVATNHSSSISRNFLHRKIQKEPPRKMKTIAGILAGKCWQQYNNNAFRPKSILILENVYQEIEPIFFSFLCVCKVLLSMNVIMADDQCPTSCTADHGPLCAGPDGSQNPAEWRNFDNQCALDIHNCNNKDIGDYQMLLEWAIIKLTIGYISFFSCC